MKEHGELKVQEGWLKTNQNIVITWNSSEQRQFKKRKSFLHDELFF